MSAPALVMLSPGSSDPKVTQVAHQLRREVQSLRPEISVNTAFLGHCPPTGPQVVSQLTARGHEEIVFVPMCLTRAASNCDDLETLVSRVRSTYPNIRFSVSEPVGPAGSLLTVVDLRLRAALAQSRVLEVDGLVLTTEGGGDVRGGALLARRARQWAAHHRVPVVAASCDGSGPSTSQAVGILRSQGRRHIAVGSLFLAADHTYTEQVVQARRAGAVAVAEPIGAHRELIDLVLARYAYAAMGLLEFEGELVNAATA
jgi:sirohydrochlorin ferrochelatase